MKQADKRVNESLNEWNEQRNRSEKRRTSSQKEAYENEESEQDCEEISYISLSFRMKSPTP